MFLKGDIAGVYTSRAMVELGIKCPEEMPMLGVSDDIVFCHLTPSPLSSIPYPGRRIAFETATLLHKMMCGIEIRPNQWMQFPPESVVARESTRKVILADPVVTTCMDLLKTQLDHRLVSVAELCQNSWAQPQTSYP